MNKEREKQEMSFTDLWSSPYSNALGNEAGQQAAVSGGITAILAYILWKYTWERKEMDGIGFKIITVVVAIAALVQIKRALF